MEGKSFVWAEDDVVLAVDIFGLCLMIVVQTAICGSMSNRCTSRANEVDRGKKFVSVEPLALKTAQRIPECTGEFCSYENQFGRASPRFSNQWPRRAPALQCGDPPSSHLELQDRRDYAPADRAARTCWLAVPVPVLFGGLRRKTQLFSCALYMAASSKTPPY
ncbi:hypothetical protein TNCV_1966971 [Trichonephila clavipes]|nr:hypothetical protein TNCV_1966971 [Trichonephila clavipes]